MATRIIIGIIVIAAIIGGVYWYMNNHSSSSQSQQSNTQKSAGDKVQAKDVTVGAGAEAIPGSKVSVLYVGQFQDGTTFDSSAAHNNQPLVFTIGVDQIVPGFQIGVNGMKVGGERIITIPPSLGYGTTDLKDPNGKVVIPANSTLIFDIKLIKVEAASSTSSTATTTRNR